MGTAVFSIEDYSNETGRSTINVGDISLATIQVVQDAVDDLKLALQPIILGQIRQIGLNQTFIESGAAVTDPNAQRETKFLVRYRDTNQYLGALNTAPNPGYNQVFNVEIPTAELATHLVPGTDVVDMANAEIAAFVTAFEAVARSPYNQFSTNPTIDVVEILFVGRNT